MTAKEYYNQIINLIGDIINLSEVHITSVDEQEKQVLGAYCFGVLNGYWNNIFKRCVLIKVVCLPSYFRIFAKILI